MNWQAFFAWLEQNGVRYNPGDIHYAGRGYWYPVPPPNPDEKPPAPWIAVEEDREAKNRAVFVSSSWGESVYAESPVRAKAFVEKLLMDFDQQGSLGGFNGRSTWPGPPFPKLRRDEPGWKGEYLTPALPVWEEKRREALERIRRERESQPDPEPRKGTGPEYKGEALKLRGFDDDDVTDVCDHGHHERCPGCGCSCHVFKRCTGCGRTYSRAQWDELPLLGKQKIDPEDGDPGCVMIGKNCACTGTMFVEE